MESCGPGSEGRGSSHLWVLKVDSGYLKSAFCVFLCVLFWLDGVFCLALVFLIEEIAYKQK